MSPAGPEPASRYGEVPYPGARPEHSFVQHENMVLPLRRDEPGGAWVVAWTAGDDQPDRHDPRAPGRWVALDEWLTDREVPVLADRVPLLSYGSNACPSKLVRLRRERGLWGPVVMTVCTVTGVAAAWCHGRRSADGAVPATLAVAPGTEEAHVVWWVAPDQGDAVDRCEARGVAYDLVRLPTGVVRDDLGSALNGVLTYVGCHPDRYPLLDAQGRPLLVREHDQQQARHALERSEREGSRTAGGEPAAHPWEVVDGQWAPVRP